MKSLVLSVLFFIFTFLQINYLSAQTLSIREVYDLHPGDEMGIYHETNGPWEYIFHKVIDRTDFGNDSFKITYFNGRYFAKNMAWHHEFDTSAVTYKEVDKPYFEQFDMQDTLRYGYAPWDSLKERPHFKYEFNDTFYLDSCNTFINQRYTHQWTILSGERKVTWKACKGLGTIRNYYELDAWPPYEDNESFVYYIKDGRLCGTKEGFQVSVSNAHTLSGISVHPNPASEYIDIISGQAADYRIYNLKGQILMSGSVEGKAQVKIKELEAGLYIITLESNGKSMSQTLIIE